MAKKKIRVLLAPLDWGLGHTTRCFPLLTALSQLDAEILIACNSVQKKVFQSSFPHLSYIPLEGYNIQYGRTRWGTIFRIIRQIPRIFAHIKRENRWLEALMTEEPVDLIISDNRFGLFHGKIHCIFLTHQLKIRSGLGPLTDYLLQRINYRFINRFSACWVPDTAGSNNLAGELAHPQRLPAVPVFYLGPLSRFQPVIPGKDRIPLLILLSGPEPQRSLLEKMLLPQLGDMGMPCTVLRGLPGEAEIPLAAANIRIFNHADTAQLNEWLVAAEWVCCRSGYTSIMDLMMLRKKCILIPTPGQAEQEYLGRRMQQNSWARTARQNKLNLAREWEEARKMNLQRAAISPVNLATFIANYLDNSSDSATDPNFAAN